MTVCTFRTPDGLRLAIDPETVEAVLEQDGRGCRIVTANDTYGVDASFAEVTGAIWPDLFK